MPHFRRVQGEIEEELESGYDSMSTDSSEGSVNQNGTEGNQTGSGSNPNNNNNSNNNNNPNSGS